MSYFVDTDEGLKHLANSAPVEAEFEARPNAVQIHNYLVEHEVWLNPRLCKGVTEESFGEYEKAGEIHIIPYSRTPPTF